MTTPISALRCALPGCSKRPDPGLLVCEPHHRTLGQTIADIEDLYATLDLRPAQVGNDTGRHSSGGTSPAPARVAVLALTDPRTTLYAPTAEGPACTTCRHTSCAARRARPADDERAAGATRLVSVVGVLHEWATRVRTERGITPPARYVAERYPWAPAGPFCEPWCDHWTCTEIAWRRLVPVTPTVSAERAVLARNLDWICAQPWVPVLWTEIRDVWSQLREAHGQHRPRPACKCPVPSDQHGRPCGGNVWAGDRQAYCDRCDTRWTGTDFLRLSLIAEREPAS